MTNTGKRIFAALLVLAMVLALVPVGSAAVRTCSENGGKSVNAMDYALLRATVLGKYQPA